MTASLESAKDAEHRRELERFDTILDCRKNLGLCYVTERQKLNLDVAGVS